MIREAEELRQKESDRVETVAAALRDVGADVEALDDGLIIQGTGGLGGGKVFSHGDHRIAMVGAIAGIASDRGVSVVGFDAADVSYPGFAKALEDLVTKSQSPRAEMPTAQAPWPNSRALEQVVRDIVEGRVDPYRGAKTPPLTALFEVFADDWEEAWGDPATIEKLRAGAEENIREFAKEVLASLEALHLRPSAEESSPAGD